MPAGFLGMKTQLHAAAEFAGLSFPLELPRKIEEWRPRLCNNIQGLDLGEQGVILGRVWICGLEVFPQTTELLILAGWHIPVHDSGGDTDVVFGSILVLHRPPALPNSDPVNGPAAEALGDLRGCLLFVLCASLPPLALVAHVLPEEPFWPSLDPAKGPILSLPPVTFQGVVLPQACHYRGVHLGVCPRHLRDVGVGSILWFSFFHYPLALRRHCNSGEKVALRRRSTCFRSRLGNGDYAKICCLRRGRRRRHWQLDPRPVISEVRGGCLHRSGHLRRNRG